MSHRAPSIPLCRMGGSEVRGGLGRGGLTWRSRGREEQVPCHPHPEWRLWAQAPGPRPVLRRVGCGGSRRAWAPALATRCRRKARAYSGLWARARPHPPLHGRPGQRSWVQLRVPAGEAHAGPPGSCSCTPPRRQSCWRCRGSRHTRSGCTGPRRGRSTSGQPSLHRSPGHWAAGTALGALRARAGESAGARPPAQPHSSLCLPALTREHRLGVGHGITARRKVFALGRWGRGQEPGSP